MRLKKGFISVNTGLPALYEKVLVLTKYGVERIAWRPYGWSSFFFMTDGSPDYNGDLCAGEVIGWKPVKGMVK